VVVVCMEQQCQRGQPWRRWKNSDDSPLPRLDWTDGEVEKVEKTTARLQADWATCFHGGERARRRRRTVGNGGLHELACSAWWRRRNENWSGRVRRAGARGAQDAASSARMPVARGLRPQAIGDGWCHAAMKI